MALQATVPLIIIGASIYIRTSLYQRVPDHYHTNLHRFPDGTTCTTQERIVDPQWEEIQGERINSIKNPIPLDFRLPDSFFAESILGSYPQANVSDAHVDDFHVKSLKENIMFIPDTTGALYQRDRYAGFKPTMIISSQVPEKRVEFDILIESQRRERDLRGLPPLPPETPLQFQQHLMVRREQVSPYWTAKWEKNYPHHYRRYQQEREDWERRRLTRMVESTYEGGMEQFTKELTKKGLDITNPLIITDALQKHYRGLKEKYLPLAEKAYKDEVEGKGRTEGTDLRNPQQSIVKSLRAKPAFDHHIYNDLQRLKLAEEKQKEFKQMERGREDTDEESEHSANNKSLSSSSPSPKPFKLSNYFYYVQNGLFHPQSSPQAKFFNYLRKEAPEVLEFKVVPSMGKHRLAQVQQALSQIPNNPYSADEIIENY